MKSVFSVIAVILSIPFNQMAVGGDRENASVALEKKLHGEWKGGPGVGEIIFRPDGTFERRNYSSGDHTLKGTWELKWKALPPTLLLKCKESTNPEFVDSVLSVSLVRLNNDEFAYQTAGDKSSARFDRRLRVRAKVVYGSGPRKEKVADVEPWISKVVKADYALVVPITDWITVSAEWTTLDSGNGYYLDGKVTQEKGEFKVEIHGCAGVPLRSSATMKPGERTVVNVRDGKFKTDTFIALEVIEKK